MTTTFNEMQRRQVGLAIGNRNVANVLCDAIATATDAVAAIDQFLIVPLPDLDAGDDLDDVHLFEFDFPVTLQSIKLIAQGSFAGVDASNTIVVTVKDGDAHTIVTKTYTNAVVPTNSGANALGTLDATHKSLAANEPCTMTITCGATADPPAMAVQIRFRAS